MPVRQQTTAAPLLTSALLLSLAAGCTQDPIRPDARAADPQSRIPALVGSARASDPDSLDQLIYALGDDDAAVRLFAIQSLKDRTGQDLGYRYYDPPEQRAQAQRRWRQWLNEQPDPATPAPPNDPTPTATGDPPQP